MSTTTTQEAAPAQPPLGGVASCPAVEELRSTTAVLRAHFAAKQAAREWRTFPGSACAELAEEQEATAARLEALWNDEAVREALDAYDARQAAATRGAK